MKYFKSLSFLVMLLGCAMYSYWLSNRNYEWVVPYMDQRAPAAVRESGKFEEVLDKPMRVFKRELVAASIDVRASDGQHGFSMGQFAVKSSGEDNLVCLEYPYMKLTFSGEGAALGGKKMQIVVSAPCNVDAKNKERISTIPLPFSELSRRPAQNQEFRLMDATSPADVRIENVFGDWPRLWQLENVEFFKDPELESEDRITISAEELRTQQGQPLYVK